MIRKSANNRTHFILFLLVLTALTLIMMYIYSPINAGHDFSFHLNRLIVLMEALKNGNFPAYMDYKMLGGYGYITKLFYSDVLLLPIAWVGNLTSTEFAYQTMILANTVLSGLFSYLAFKKVTDNRYAGYIGAIFYTFSAYRILDIYVRCAVGEVFTFTFLPLILLGAYELIYGNHKRWYILTLGFTLLLYSHLISTVIAFALLLFFMCCEYKKLKKEYYRLYYILIAGVVSVLLTAYYVFPMIEQMLSNTFFYQTINANADLVSYDIKSFVFAFASTFIQKYDGVYATIGIILLIPIALRLFIRNKEKNKTLRFVDVCLILSVLMVLASIDVFPWQYYPFKLLNFIQFSWRLNLFSTLFLSLAGGYYLVILLQNKWKKEHILIAVAVVHMGIMGVNGRYYAYLCESRAQSENYDISSFEYNTKLAGISGAEYLPAKIANPYHDIEFYENQRIKSENQTTDIAHFTKDKGHIIFDVEVTNDDKLELPLTYYIGYTATLDGEPLPYQQSESGLIEIPVNKSGKVEVVYAGTTLQRVSYYITMISIILFTIFIIVNRKKNKQSKQQ